MTAKKAISKTGPSKNDGKKAPGVEVRNGKLTAKYTLWRSKEDIDKIRKLKRYLNDKSSRSFNTDSQVYKELPDLYLNAVKKVSDHQLAIDELTAKVEQLQQLQDHICRIFEICKMEEHD